MTNAEQLRNDTIQADACALLEFMKQRICMGNTVPATTREALEAIHRAQGADLNPRDAAHMAQVASLIVGALPVSRETPRPKARGTFDRAAFIAYGRASIERETKEV